MTRSRAVSERQSSPVSLGATEVDGGGGFVGVEVVLRGGPVRRVCRAERSAGGEIGDAAAGAGDGRGEAPSGPRVGVVGLPAGDRRDGDGRPEKGEPL